MTRASLAAAPGRATVAAAVTVLSLVLGACGTGREAAPPSPAATTSAAASISAGDDEVDVLTWWADGREKAGLDALLGVLDDQSAGRVAFTEVSSPMAPLRQALPERIHAMTSARYALDSFQVEGGDGTVRKLVAAGDVQALDGVYADLGLADVWPERLVDLLATDGHLYAMPAVADRTNLLWSNRHVLADAGLDPDATYGSVDEWITAMRQVAAAGGRPLALGRDWTQALLLEDVLLAELGPGRFQGLWDGTTDWAGGDVERAVGKLLTIVAMSSPDRDGLDWTDQTRSVAKGKAAFTVMGDWARAELEERSAAAGEDYTVQPAPGTAGSFVFITDSFAWSGSAGHPASTRTWFDAMASRDGQSAVALAFDGVPVRTDVDLAPFDAFQRTEIADWRRDVLVRSVGVDGSDPDDIETILREAVASLTAGATTVADFQTAMAAGVSRR